MVQSAAARAAIRRRGDRLFAPTTTRVWLTEDGEVADRQVIERCLDLPYSKEPGVARYTDTNLHSARIHLLMERFPETFASWADNCATVRERAHAIVLDDSELRVRQAEALSGAARDSALRHAQLSARIRTLRGLEAEKEQQNLKLEIELDDALRVGIVNPSIRLDVIGFLVLSRDPFPVDARVRESAP
jgi:ATP-dependent helicase HepA